MEQKNVENSTIEKKIFVFSVFILALLIITAITISYLLLSNEILDLKQNVEDNDVPTFEEKEENNDDNKAENTYMLKEYNGKIGVYENNALIYTLDTYVFTLPEIDKKLLGEGIKTASKTELYELIEEYY